MKANELLINFVLEFFSLIPGLQMSSKPASRILPLSEDHLCLNKIVHITSASAKVGFLSLHSQLEFIPWLCYAQWTL